ncbi:MAG: hypothetical protein WBM00_12820 [Solirubrobacterales bacterium]
MEADEVAAWIDEIIAADDVGMLLLFRYKIGDDYETECDVSGLTVSREHLTQLRREGDTMRATAFFPPELVPEKYRDRVSATGVVPIGVEIQLGEVIAVQRMGSAMELRESKD